MSAGLIHTSVWNAAHVHLLNILQEGRVLGMAGEESVDGGEWRTEVREDPLPSYTLKRKGKIPFYSSKWDVEARKEHNQFYKFLKSKIL